MNSEKNNAPIRIVYLIDNLAKGGAQTALIYLVRYLSKRNYKQRIYSLNNDVHPDNRKALIECGAEVKVIGKMQLIVAIGLIRLFYDWIGWKPTIVFTMLFYSDVIGRLIAKFIQCPIIISSIRAKNIYKNELHFYFDRFTAQWADKVVFNSRQVVPFAIEHEGIKENQVVYIPNGVNTTDNYSKLNRFEKCKELGISKDTLIIGSIGRLNSQKGFFYLLQSIQIIQKQFHKYLVLIIGAGHLLEELKSLAKELNISDKVMFLGERSDIFELLSCMDVYTQPSLFEGMPNVVMEAMAVGKPVVATSVDGILELIEEGKTGWLVEPKNSKMLADKINYVLNHPELAEKVGVAGAKHIAINFSLEKMGHSYDRLFRGLIAEKL